LCLIDLVEQTIVAIAMFSLTLTAIADTSPAPKPTMDNRLQGSTYVAVGVLGPERTIKVPKFWLKDKVGDLIELRVAELQVERFILPTGCPVPRTMLIDITTAAPLVRVIRREYGTSSAIYFLLPPYGVPPGGPVVYRFGSFHNALFPLPGEAEAEVVEAIPREMERLRRGGYTRSCPQEDQLKAGR